MMMAFHGADATPRLSLPRGWLYLASARAFDAPSAAYFTQPRIAFLIRRATSHHASNEELIRRRPFNLRTLLRRFLSMI